MSRPSVFYLSTGQFPQPGVPPARARQAPISHPDSTSLATETRTVRGHAANDLARGRRHLARDEVHHLIRAAKNA